MRPADVVRFAWVSLRGYPARTALMGLAMAIGVAAVVILTALGDGARRYVINQFSSLGTNLLIVFPGRSETAGATPGMFIGQTPRDLTLDDALALTRSRAVRRVAPLSVGSAQVSFGGRSREAPVVGSTADWLAIRNMQIAQGSFLPPGDPRAASPVCVIGATVRDELFGNASAVGQFVRIGNRRTYLRSFSTATNRDSRSPSSLLFSTNRRTWMSSGSRSRRSKAHQSRFRIST